MKTEMRSEYNRHNLKELQPDQLGHRKEEKSDLTDGYGRISRKLRISPTLEFIKQSDNDKNSNQEARVEYHNWRLLPD